jgi:hypothetical protein
MGTWDARARCTAVGRSGEQRPLLVESSVTNSSKNRSGATIGQLHSSSLASRDPVEREGEIEIEKSREIER